MVEGRYVLLFDEDCSICSAASRLIRAVDIRRRIHVRPILASRDLLRGVPEERILDAFHVVSPDGRVTTGGDAVPVLVEAFPMGAGAARLLQESAALLALTHRAYSFAARFRDALTCRVRAAPSAWAASH
jgi:predicted DCC family thiol-disulfide oxidoreductase YuxK